MKLAEDAPRNRQVLTGIIGQSAGQKLGMSLTVISGSSRLPAVPPSNNQMEQAMLDHDQLAIPGFDDHPVVMADPSCQALTRSASADEQSVANQAPILIPAHPFNTRQFGAYELLGYQLGKKLDKAVGNLVNIYDFLPRFMWSGRTVKAVALIHPGKRGHDPR